MSDEELLCLKITSLLEKIEAKYFITGSVAAMYYGEPRMTRAIDVVVALGYGGVHAIVNDFAPP